MNNDLRIHSLKTDNLADGVVLSTVLARDLSRRLATTDPTISKPGGMNFLDPAPIPVEMIAGILLVAVSIANNGWSKSGSEQPA